MGPKKIQTWAEKFGSEAQLEWDLKKRKEHCFSFLKSEVLKEDCIWETLIIIHWARISITLPSRWHTHSLPFPIMDMNANPNFSKGSPPTAGNSYSAEYY